MSNRTKGSALKGSRYWMQHFVNTPDVARLNANIQAADPSVTGITWLSPLRTDDYVEWKAKEIPGITSDNLAFWPELGPLWDAVGTFDKEGILLVEAKAHCGEIGSSCTASSSHSLALIHTALENTYQHIAHGRSFTPEQKHIWLTEQYQMANRLAFLHHFRQQGKNVRLLLLCFANDYTHNPTTTAELRVYTEEQVWMRMTGQKTAPDGVLEVYLEVPDPT
ncbi:MAG: hypothetical protein QM308_08060 [Bacillota bacterium]|nr:hypothetical protein [Bacillota bacterium]